MHLKRTTEPKVMAFQSFQISMRILFVSNHLGRSFSLQLLVNLSKTYENWRSQCLNDQIIKNLWLLTVRNLLMQCYATQYRYSFCNFGCVDLVKLYETKNKMHTKWTTQPKVMAFRSFLISMRIICLSNHLGRSFYLYLLVHLLKMYGNEWSRCSNDQISKNLWPLEVCMLLMQCCATQYCNAFGSLCFVDLENLLKYRKKCIPNGRPSQRL